MSYLNPPYPNNFQELCAAMPLFYLDVFEMRAILRAQGRLLDGVCGGMEKLVDVNFILTADEATIRMWERALKITYTNKLTLDQRKHVIIGYIIGLGHIGEQEIRGIIGLYTDLEAAVSFDRGEISITLDGIGCVSGYTNLIETLMRRIPAHLGLRFSINIRSPTPAALHIGGSAGASDTLGSRNKPDVFDFRDGLHVGGGAGASDTLGSQNKPDVFDFQGTLPVGGRGGTLDILPQPECLKQPEAVSILRTGGVCTIISGMGGAQQTGP